MKRKFYVVLSVMIGFAACTSDELQEAVTNDGIPQAQQYDPNRRSFAEVAEIAQNSISMLESDKAETRSMAPARRLNLASGIKAFRQAGTRAEGSTADNDTLLYVFNFADDQGFAVVSASRHTDGLIAVVEEGSYDPAVPTGNPGFDTYMNMAKAYVAYKDRTEAVSEPADTRGVTANPIYQHVYDTIYYQNIAPKVTVKWGQRMTMGQFCPNGIAGCDNTAAAQIMSYYGYPSGHALTFSGRDTDYTSFNWSYMRARIYADKDSNWDTYDKQIGRLARQLGEHSGSTYHTDGSGTSTSFSTMRNVMVSWGYSVGSITTYNYSNSDAGYPLGTLLAANKLIFMRGENSDNEGHGWIIDGCKYVKALERIKVSYDNGVTWSVFQEMATYRTCHNHINWGWNGKGNGYFHSWILNAFNAISYDSNYYPFNNYGQNHNYYNNVKYFAVWH